MRSQVHADLHSAAALRAEHFARWLALWTATANDSFAGEKAELAKTQAARIAYSLSRRLLGESGGELVTIQRQARRSPRP